MWLPPWMSFRCAMHLHRRDFRAMGGAVSSGESNDELVDNLVSANYITTPLVERVFRSVDRGHYFPDTANDAERLPYRDVAWKMGQIHISAPCIYCEVMENIDLQPGLSFLNLGSGTGYLSTMAGLMLGANGVNHGVEIFQDMVNYAQERLAEFMARPGSLDEFEFCPPKFFCGNALLMPPGTHYDRIYCGAACNEGEQLEYLKGLLKIGGIMIAPVNSELVMIKRKTENEWTNKVLLPVSFASLLPATDSYMIQPILPRCNPLGLYEISRFAIRAILRENIIKEHPELVDCAARRATRKRIRDKRKIRSELDSEEEDCGHEFPIHVARLKFDSGIVEDCEEEDDIESIWESSECNDESDEAITPDVPVKPEPAFGEYMREKIKLLELPKPLMKFLNFGHIV